MSRLLERTFEEIRRQVAVPDGLPAENYAFRLGRVSGIVAVVDALREYAEEDAAKRPC